MKKLILLFVCSLSLIGCKTEEVDIRTECQKTNVGYFIFNNSSANPYDIFINNTLYKQQPGNTISGKISYPAGKSYTIKVQQAAGYVFSPTVKTYTRTLNQCDEITITYP